MYTWIEPVEIIIPEVLKAQIGGHPIVAQTLAQRGINDPAAAQAFLDPSNYSPESPSALPGLKKAADRLESSINSEESILVWGDFDVDGQTATTLLVSALRELGAKVEYHIPVRAHESHGVSLPVLQQWLDSSTIKVLLTCDTGITAHQSVEYAQGRGVDVIITDHHELPPELPKVYAVVNPKMLPETHTLKGLSGVGVAYKLVEEMFHRLGSPERVEQYLDLVALGLVADVAPLAGDVRYLVQRGLELLRNPRRAGLQAVYERAELNPEWVTEEHIGFVLAPRLNSLGRLSDANSAVELLSTQDIGKARLIALELEGLNSQRQLLTSQVLKGALAKIEKDRSLLENPILVLAHSGWEAGVIGIVASRLVGIYKKPAVLISISKDGIGHGSARSTTGVDITAALREQSDLLLAFGGHTMAAGFTISEEKIPEFRRKIIRVVSDIAPKSGSRTNLMLNVDVYLDWGELSLELADDFNRLAPFGEGNPPLVVASRNLKLVNKSYLGRQKEHLLLTIEDQAEIKRRVVWWSGADYLKASGLPQGRFDLAFTLRTSTFRGELDLQLEWVDWRPVETVEAIETRTWSVVDYRRKLKRSIYTADSQTPIIENQLDDTEMEIQDANWKLLVSLEREDMQVWMEGRWARRISKDERTGGIRECVRDRSELTPCETLVIWTTPPGWQEMTDALEKTQPMKVVLFGVNPEVETQKEFLEKLAGMVKYGISNREGILRIDTLAAALAHRESTIRKGLEWMAEKGMIRLKRLVEQIPETQDMGMQNDRNLDLEEEQVEEWEASLGGENDPEQAEKILEEIKLLIDETCAYRGWFGRVEKVF